MIPKIICWLFGHDFKFEQHNCWHKRPWCLRCGTKLGIKE